VTSRIVAKAQTTLLWLFLDLCNHSCICI